MYSILFTWCLCVNPPFLNAIESLRSHWNAEVRINWQQTELWRRSSITFSEVKCIFWFNLLLLVRLFLLRKRIDVLPISSPNITEGWVGILQITWKVFLLVYSHFWLKRKIRISFPWKNEHPTRTKCLISCFKNILILLFSTLNGNSLKEREEYPDIFLVNQFSTS